MSACDEKNKFKIHTYIETLSLASTIMRLFKSNKIKKNKICTYIETERS